MWERQIGTIRRGLDAMLLKIGASQLDDELLLTLMAEVPSIVNSRPITVVSADVDKPVPLSYSGLPRFLLGYFWTVLENDYELFLFFMSEGDKWSQQDIEFSKTRIQI